MQVQLWCVVLLLLTVPLPIAEAQAQNVAAAPPKQIWKQGATDEIPLWPNGAPGEKGDIPPETATQTNTSISVANVTVPTIEFYRPAQDHNTGAAVIVSPGGAYTRLSIVSEGTEVCDWLNSIGVTCVLLKYRVPARAGFPRYTLALQDIQRAIGMVRSRATEFGIDQIRVGVLGFSAGGHLSAAASTNYDKRTYPRVDAADDLGSRPDFTILVYPAYLSEQSGGNLGGRGLPDGIGDKLEPELTITDKTPPTFIVQTADDPYRQSAIVYYLALRNAGVKAELHIFPVGGHGYGLRSKERVNIWPQLAQSWMQSLGVLGPPAK